MLVAKHTNTERFTSNHCISTSTFVRVVAVLHLRTASSETYGNEITYVQLLLW